MIWVLHSRKGVSGQLPMRTISQRTGFVPEVRVVLFRGSGPSGELSWCMVNSPRDCGPGGQWLGFIFIWWGIVLMGSCLRT